VLFPSILSYGGPKNLSLEKQCLYIGIKE